MVVPFLPSRDRACRSWGRLLGFPLCPVVLMDPSMGEVEHFGGQEQIVPAKVRRIFPGVALAIDASQCDVVALAGARLVLPDGRLDQAQADFMDGSVRTHEVDSLC